MKPLAFLLLPLTLLLLPLLSSDTTLSARDALPFAAPQHRTAHRALTHLRLPHWDSSQHLGVPFLASPPAQALYPPTVLARLLSPSPTSATDALATLHLVLAALGALWLAHELRLRTPGRVTLAACYALGGPVLSNLDNLPTLTGAAWLPLGVASLLRLRTAPSPRHLALATLCLSLPVLGGSLQTGLWLALLATLLLAPTHRPHLAALALTSALCVACLALPAAHLLAQSTRAALDYAEVGRWSTHPLRLTELLLPLPFGTPSPDRASYLAPALEPSTHEFWIHSLSLGFASSLLLLRGLSSPHRRTLLTLSLLLLALALGRHTPLHPALAAHTPYGIFRYPAKHLVPLSLCLSVLAALGADLVARHPLSRRWLALPALTALTALALHLYQPHLAQPLQRTPPPLLPQLTCTVLVQLAVFAASHLPRHRGTALAALVAFTAVPLARPLIQTAPASLTATRWPAVTHLHDPAPFPPRVYRTSAPFGAPPPGLTPAQAIPAVQLMTLQGASCALYDLEGVHGMTGFTPARWQRLVTTVPTALERAAAPHALVPPHTSGATLLPLEVGLLRRPARPRLEVLAGLEWKTDAETIWTRLQDPDAGVLALGDVDDPGPLRAAGHVDAARRPHPERLVVDVTADAPATLVVRDAAWPGWTATLDGAPTPLLSVDGAFMGVRLPPGPHRVELRFHTPGLPLGWWLTAAGVALTLAAAFAPQGGPRAPQPRPLPDPR